MIYLPPAVVHNSPPKIIMLTMFIAALPWCLGSVIVGIVCASFFEWVLHRYIMHKPFGSFTYPFERHALVHHRIFKADHTYHLIREADKHTIPMAWWNGPVMILACTAFFGSLWWLAFGTAHLWPVVTGICLAFSAYYSAYEYIHWCMHLPRKRNIERSGIFFRLNGHHLLHHRYMHRNFNVVMPLADLCLGTLLTRSRIRFNQATGPAVPNVQPFTQKAAVPECVGVE